MNLAQTNLVNSYSAKVINLQNKINAVHSQLTSGKNLLTEDQKSTVTKLSQAITSYNSPQNSIDSAQKTIAVAQTAITSILPIIRDMQQLASQAADPKTDNDASTSFNNRFQEMLTNIGKLATGASLNSANLLSGTAGMNVLLDPNNTPQSRSFINSVDIYGMMTMGILGGVKLDTPSSAQTALGSLNSALSQIMGKQFYLKLTSDNLTAQAEKLTKESTAKKKSLDELQIADPVKLKAQLANLKKQQNIDYELVSQIDPASYEKLKLRNLLASTQINAAASVTNALAAVNAAKAAVKATT